MISKDGNVEMECNGTTIGLRLNTWAFREAQKSIGCASINELLNKTGLITGEINCDTFLLFMLEAVKEYRFNKKMEGDITLRDVSEMIDIMGGLPAAAMMVSEGLKQYLPKN